MKKLVAIIIFLMAFMAIPAYAIAGDELSPSGLTAKTTGKAVELKWKAAKSDEVKGYIVKKSEIDGTLIPISFVNASVLKYTDKEVEKGKTYIYVVVSNIASKKEAGQSNEAIVTIKKNTNEEPPLKNKELDDSQSDEFSKKSSKKNKSDQSAELKAPDNVDALIKTNEKNEKKFVLVSWNESAGATSYKIYRATGESDDYAKIGEVKKETEFQDLKFNAKKPNFYYVVAHNAKGDSDRSKIAAATLSSSVSGSNIGKQKYMFYLCVLDNVVAVVYDFENGEIQFTKINAAGSWETWRRHSTLSLPPDFDSATDYLSFATDPQYGFAAFIWSSKTKKTLHADCNSDTLTFSPWQEFPNLPVPPNFSPDTMVMFERSAKQAMWISYNLKDKTVYSSSYQSDTWTTWNSLGNLPLPENNSPKSFYSLGVFNPLKSSEIKMILYCYNFERNTIYYSTYHGNSQWLNWQPLPQMFGVPAGLSE